MREIKFRQFDKCINQFVFFELVNVEIVITNDKVVSFDDDRADSPTEQFTGFKDINDVDIYEGDVLTIWIQGCKQTTPYIVEDMRELYLETERDDRYYRINKMEIIGNIYTNPELRK